MTGGIIGTAEYMSPEQGQGRRITKRSDLYALGAVMYVMLTGRPPFSGKTTLDVIHKHKYNQFDRPRTIVPEIPYWLDEIVCQLMEKDPEKRPGRRVRGQSPAAGGSQESRSREQRADAWGAAPWRMRRHSTPPARRTAAAREADTAR